MEYSDFYDIAVYANVNWNKGNFSQKEVACYAYCYYADFQWSKENDVVSETIKTLLNGLTEDLHNMSEDDVDRDNVRYWLYQLQMKLL